MREAEPGAAPAVKIATSRPRRHAMTAKKASKKAPAKKAAKAAEPAAEKKPRSKKKPKAKRPSAPDAAAPVLGEASAPMNCQEMIKAMVDKGYWSSPKARRGTPRSTRRSCGRSMSKARKRGS